MYFIARTEVIHRTCVTRSGDEESERNLKDLTTFPSYTLYMNHYQHASLLYFRCV